MISQCVIMFHRCTIKFYICPIFVDRVLSTTHIPPWSSVMLLVPCTNRLLRLDMGLGMISWVRGHQMQCWALRPLGHQGYRLRGFKKDPPVHSGYMVAEDSKTLPLESLLIPSDHRVFAGLSTVRSLPAPPPTLHSQHRHVGRRRTVHLSALIMVIGIGLGFIPVLTVV